MNQPQMAAPPMADGHAEPRTLPSLQAVLWIGWFSLREMSRRKRLLSLGAISLLPVLVVLAIRIWFGDQGITPQLQLSLLTHKVIIPFLIPIVAMAVGVSAIGEQVEEGTIVYLWTRPVRRRAIYLGRLIAAQIVSSQLLALSLCLCFLVMVSNGLKIIDWEFLKLYLITFLIIFLGSFAYSSVFAAMGTFFRKPVLPAILFAFGWEGMINGIPARVQELSLLFHLRNIVELPKEAPANLSDFLSNLLNQVVVREPVPKWESAVVLVMVMLFFAVSGVWLFRMKEIEK